MSVKHQADVTDNNWTYVIRPGSYFSAYRSKIGTYIMSIRPLTEALPQLELENMLLNHCAFINILTRKEGLFLDDLVRKGGITAKCQENFNHKLIRSSTPLP